MEPEADSEHLVYKCKLSDNVIEYKGFRGSGEAYMEYTHIDPRFYKAFFVVLRTSIDSLKGKGYQKLVQTVTEEDWQGLQHDKWRLRGKILHAGGLTVLAIECDLDDALECISRGLGLNSS